MNIAWILLFLVSAGSLFHTYFFYPLLLGVLSRKKSSSRPLFQAEDQWPRISILLSVFNEEGVIEQKLDTLFQTDYPADRLEIFIGSDASFDRTNELVQSLVAGRKNVHFEAFPDRRGKPSVLNDLVALALESTPASTDHLFLITDANVFLEPDTVRMLARHFKDPEIGLVDAHMVNTGQAATGISRSETQYIQLESRIKYWEGQLWGTMIGPFGGCYLLRSDLFDPIPPNFLVDDFYIAMRAFEKGAKAINDLEARCYEAVSHEIKEEFRRKSRIAAGNFQNLMTFRHLWFPPRTALGFSFFSHKILRWLGPFFLFFMFLSSFVLALQGNNLFLGLFLFQLVLWGLIPMLDYLLLRFGIHNFLLRSIRYFFAMNLALLAGFFRFFRGVHSGAWDPPKRL